MTTNSEVGKLILANRKLSELDKPFNIYYPYFLLAEKLQNKINEFFKEENIEFLKEISCSTTDASSFSCHKGGPVKSEFTLDLKSIILGFLGIKIKISEIKEVKRPIFKGLNWEILDGYKVNLNEAWAKNVGIERDGRIRDFWLRARNCNSDLDKSPRTGHSSFETLDLIAACSGYTSFADFLQMEFGEGYEKEKDALLQALIKSSNKTNIDHSQRKNKVKAFKIIVFKRLEVWSQTAVKPIKRNKRTIAYLLASLGMAVSFFIMSISAEETPIKVVVSTRYLNFETAHASLIRSNESLLLACDNHFSIRNGVYSLDYPFPSESPGLARFKPIKQDHIGIEYLKIPALSQITIETPTKNEVYLNFSEAAGLNGFIPLNRTILFSPDEEDSVAFENSPSGIGVNFESYVDQTLDFTMVNSIDFEWPPIYINSISFGQLMQDQVVYGIESAQITFLNDDKIKQLDPEDLLNTTFENPIKLLLSYKEGLLYTEFTGSVNTLYAGPEIFGKSVKNNLMPTIGENYWVYFIPIFLAIFVIIHLSFRSEDKI